MTDIPVLTENQKAHVQKVEKCLEKYNRYINNSSLGSGKTYVTCELARKYSLSLLIICPKSVINEWQKIAKLFQVNIIDCISYSCLRSNSSVKNPKHQLLTRDNGKFVATEKFQEIIKKGVIVVFDECHNLKNDSDQFRACYTLAQKVYSSKKSTFASKVFLLSGTLFDKPQHAIQMTKLLGIIRKNTIVELNQKTQQLEWTGLNDVIKHCRIIDRKLTNHTITNQSYVAESRKKMSTMKIAIELLVFDLFVKVLKPVYIHCMENSEIDQIFDVKNGHYNLETQQDQEHLKSTIFKLSSASNFNPKKETNPENDKEISIKWNLIAKQLHEIERCKIGTLIRLVKKDLESNPNAKVLLFVNYLDSIESLDENLKKYSPLVMKGNVSLGDRKIIVEKFQKPSTENRLFICNTTTGNAGISLHDLDGNFPRISYIIPSYSLLNTHQASYRTFRNGVKSNTKVRFVYANIATQETNILNALMRKTATLKSLNSENTTQMKFPCDFDSEIEK